MRSRRWIYALALAGVLLAGYGFLVLNPEPTPLQRAQAAAEELRAAADRVTSYRADFTATFRQVVYSADFGWTGSMRATGRDWSATGDLKRSGKDWARLESVHHGDARYHKQTGQQLTLTQWHQFQGPRATNYFWYIGHEGVDTPPQPLPEFEPLAYLSVNSATEVTLSDLPGGGRRYAFAGNRWIPGGRMAATFDTFPYISYIPLVVDLDRDRRPVRVEVGPFNGSTLDDITITITLHDIGADVTVAPPPADQVVPER
ncbi:hypothetical protein Val02_30040 [Virgisporangium aliadipatigenens]|uniref:Uncharacterized protein n=1 Tax=Virgisporangium aliadipatigenens TaxID=741659 RepID=A0A8J3YLT9_9ACTN|nr:hypothetical protein [Virgisporangium aliadipatigenens]GIJ46118.1 hypothetical protein Val02_30040 [Virgisporangium aliadipatigenens]